MKKNRKIFIVLLFFSILIVIIGLIVISLYITKKRTIRVAAILPLTGAASHHRAIADAMKLAIDDINSSGGLNGKKIKLYIADCHTDTEISKQVFLEIEKKIKPLLYISSTSLISLTLAPLAEENNVVLIGIVASHPDLTKNKKWVFKYHTTTWDETKPVLKIIEKLNNKTLGILYQDDPFGKSHYNIVMNFSIERGINVQTQQYPAAIKDFTFLTEDFLSNEAIYIAGFTSNVEKAILYLSEHKYKGHILSHSGTVSSLNHMKNINDVYASAPIIYNPNFIYSLNIKKRYEEKYKTDFALQSAIGYDVIKILSGVLEGQKLDREKVREILESGFSYPGIFGFIEKEDGEHIISFPLYGVRISNGKIEYLLE